MVDLRDSVTFPAILTEGRDEGRTEEARSVLLRLGARKLGAPPAAVEQQIQAIKSVPRLNGLIDRILDAADWQDVLKNE